MRRPHTIVGLSLEVLRRRGLPRRSGPLLAALALVAGTTLVARHRQPAVAPPSDAALTAWRTAPFDGEVGFVDPTVVATPTGWVLAWTRWPRRGVPSVQVAALARDGSLRGSPTTLSPEGAWSRGTAVARNGDRVAVAWTSMSDDQRYARRPWIAAVDADGRVVVTPRALGEADESNFDLSLASDGQGWGLAWRSYGAQGTLALARLRPDATPRGPITRTADASSVQLPALAWVDDAWLVAYGHFDEERVRSSLTLRWFDRGGRLVETQRLASAPGVSGDVNVVARGGSAWLSWGDDGLLGMRHDPRFARVEGRRVASGPRLLGPRRTGSVASLACTGAGCLGAWVGVSDGRDEPTALLVQALDGDGEARGEVRRVGPHALVPLRSAVALAYATDEREALAVWTLGPRDGYRLMTVRVGADGAPIGAPAVLPLP